MPAIMDNSVDQRIAEFDEALALLERAQISRDAGRMARAVHQGEMSVYTVSKRLELLQPSEAQWATIDDRLARLGRWLGLAR